MNDRNRRTVQASTQASKRLVIEDHLTPENRDNSYPGIHILMEIGGATNTGISIDPGELAAALDGVVPGFHASYREPEQEPESGPSPEETKAAVDLLVRAGYTVAAPERTPYWHGVLLHAQEQTHRAIRDQGGTAVTTETVLQALTVAGFSGSDSEIFVEIDRALLREEFAAAQQNPFINWETRSEMLSYLWPVVVRIDEVGDVILHATGGERAQS